MKLAVAFALTFCTALPSELPAPAARSIAVQATAAREANRGDEAVALYRQALRKDPKWAEGWWHLGTFSYERDNFAECGKAFTRFTALSSKSGPAFVMLGLCEFRLGQYDAALSHIRKGEALGLAEDAPLTRAAYFHEALLMTRLQNYERALFLLSLLIKDGQQDMNAVAAMGIAALRRPVLPKELPVEDRPLALRVGQAIALGFQRQPVEARQAFDAVIAEYPRLPNLHYTYGTFLQAQDAEAAIREWKAELKITPGHLPSLFSLAMEYISRGDSASAKPFAEQAMRVSPGHFTSRAAMGRVLLESGNHLGAIPHLEIAARLAPENPQVRLALATAYGRAGRSVEASRERQAFAALKKGSASEHR